MPPRTLISIHDVMPETLDRVATILGYLGDAGVTGGATLLVVPGKDWSDDDISRLRNWAGNGHELAGHGWTHEASRISGFRHWLHSRLISRNVAEHLALDEAGIRQLVADCHAWFGKRALPPPSLYVPPAWAMGPIDLASLQELPFRYYETLSGTYDADADQFVRTPLLGFEADTRFRAMSLRLFNLINRGIARLRGQVRLAIHPRDFELLLASDLQVHLDKCG